MISEWDIYWITRLDEIRVVALLLAGFALFALVFLIVASAAEGRVVCKGTMAALLSVVALAGGAYTFTPSTKDMVTIKVIPAIVNSETAYRVTHETVEAALRLIEKVGKEDR